MRKFFRKLYKLIDVLIVVPISRLIYNIQKALKKNGGLLDKLLNKPNFLIFLSLILAIVLFLLVLSYSFTIAYPLLSSTTDKGFNIFPCL